MKAGTSTVRLRFRAANLMGRNCSQEAGAHAFTIGFVAFVFPKCTSIGQKKTGKRSSGLTNPI